MDGYNEPDFGDDALYGYEVDPTMEEQEAIQKKIEAFEQLDEDIKNGIKPF